MMPCVCGGVQVRVQDWRDIGWNGIFGGSVMVVLVLEVEVAILFAIDRVDGHWSKSTVEVRKPYHPLNDRLVVQVGTPVPLVLHRLLAASQ